MKCNDYKNCKCYQALKDLLYYEYGCYTYCLNSIERSKDNESICVGCKDNSKFDIDVDKVIKCFHLDF